MSNENSGTQTPNGAVKKRGRLIMAVVLLLIAGGVVSWYMSLGKITTDDAQVDGHVVPVSPRVAGHVAKVYVDDNQQVLPHQLLVLLDQRDLKAKLNNAEADLATQQAAAVAAGAQLALVERTAPATQGEAGAPLGRRRQRSYRRRIR